MEDEKMCYNKELCDKLMDTAEKRLDAHAADIDRLSLGQEKLFGKIDTLVAQMASSNKLLWWIVGIFGTIGAGMMAAVVGMVLK